MRDEGKPELLEIREVRRYHERKCGKTCGTIYLVHMISPSIAHAHQTKPKDSNSIIKITI